MYLVINLDLDAYLRVRTTLRRVRNINLMSNGTEDCRNNRDSQKWQPDKFP